MIGDWARLRYADHITEEEYVKDFKVSEIRKHGRCYYVWSERWGNMERVEKIEPIPLIPKILKKNGFEHTPPMRVGPTLGQKWDLREEKFHINIEFNGNGTISIEIHNELAPKNENGAADLVTYCRDWMNELYVHEFQQALRICGIKKEIEL